MSGVAQGSNQSTDTEESRLVGYADVAALGGAVVHAKSRFGILMRRVSGWFQPCVRKTEVVILIKKRIPALCPIAIDELPVDPKSAVEYLGLTGALRVASDNHTVSEPAVIAIVGVIPVALFAKERKPIYSRKGGNLRKVVVREERQRTLT